LRHCAVWLLAALGVSAWPEAAGAPDPQPAKACALAAFDAAPPAGALNVRTFGARGDGRSDDTGALQRALAALAPGQWLVFPPGTYLHDRRLSITTPGVTLDGRGATLHATNTADQALLIQADGVRIVGFTLTAVTDRRRDAPWESRIAIWRHGRGLAPLRNVEIRDNRIVESGAAGSALANSSSSAAIFVHNASHFLVHGNHVRHSLADAIHVTGGSRHGRVVGNTVREVGDDMVAVVSYRGDEQVVRDVLVADNDLSGQYWGRGVSVVGGEDVSILRNRIDATSHAAGVYLARETSFNTLGVRNVLVQGNHISRVQVQPPAYTVLSWPLSARRTGHGAIEVVAQLDAAQRRSAALRESLAVRDVAIEDNRIEDVATPGVRIGADAAEPATLVDRVMLRRNALQRIAGPALALRGAAATTAKLHCEGNTHESGPLTHARCTAAAWRVSGAAQGCERATGP
jgi:hypothetical protein